jgi:thiol-disulfide isomerase/thioredoxin
VTKDHETDTRAPARTSAAPARPAGPGRLGWTLIALGVAASILVLAQSMETPEAARARRPAAPAAPPPAARSPQQEAEARLLAEGTFYHQVSDVPAPELKVEGEDGKPLSLAKLRGKVVFVNFWATWCPPCIEEMPTMLQLGRDLAAKHPGRFAMVAVSGDDAWAPVKEYFTKNFGGVPKELTVVRDPDTGAAKAYYCAARGYCPDIKFPETYIVDRSGKIAGIAVGPRNWADPQARAWLETLIRG